MAEDKKDLKPEEQGQSGPAVSEAPAPRKEEHPAPHNAREETEKGARPCRRKD